MNRSVAAALRCALIFLLPIIACAGSAQWNLSPTLLCSCVTVALCPAIDLPEQPSKGRPPQDNAVFSANGRANRSLSYEDRVAYQRAIEEVYWRHRIWPKERPDPKP